MILKLPIFCLKKYEEDTHNDYIVVHYLNKKNNLDIRKNCQHWHKTFFWICVL